jgi:YidC/Oxa1 family membrane protein insertase
VEKRLLIFLPVAFAIYFLGLMLDQARRAANQPPPNVAAQKEPGKNAPGKVAADKAAADKAAGDKNQNPAVPKVPAAKAANDNKNNAANVGAAKPAEDNQSFPDQWYTLGSLSPPGAANSFEMLVTATSRGGAIESIELADPRYRDIDPENRFGYLGRLALVADKDEKGCKVNVVGPGTPADAAGLEVGDVIVELNGQKTPTPGDIEEVLRATKPKDAATIHVHRAGADKQLTATLGWRPLAVIRPEFDTDPLENAVGVKHDPLSFLFTMRQIDKEEISAAPHDRVNEEIDGLALRSNNWEGKVVDKDTLEFTRRLPKWDLKVVKRYRLARISPDKPDQPAYHLMLQVEIQNEGKEPHTVAYQFDGPTGLPTEGWWYASRIGVSSLRAVALKFQNNGVKLIDGMPLAQRQAEIANAKKSDKEPPKKDDSIEGPEKENEQLPLTFAGVDAQYFAAIMLPQHPAKFTPWLTDIRAIAVGDVPETAMRKKIDVTCRLTSVKTEIAPGGQLAHEYQVFVGPKLPALLDQYSAPANKAENLGDLVYYGWFWWVAKPMVALLQIFHSIVGNYGIAIIMLTVLVRLCMFPLSRKQALSAKKMQELQPEMKKINEKYKGNAQERTRATQELWRKHNYNPLGGCLLVFVQLPIFMGLYRSLMVNVQLRQASLLGEAVRWCSNLAAPDMLWNWSNVMPAMLGSETGWLGPFLNILPLATVGLFIWQQTLFMPPATDDNTALQQKLMKYITLFMGVMFFKVAAGLCIYFVASSLWGIGERKLLPKMVSTATPGPAAAAVSRPASAQSQNGSTAGRRKKQRGRK